VYLNVKISRGILPVSFAALTTACLYLSGCSPLYLTQAAYQESLILLRRRPIARVIADRRTTAEEARKLELVLAARSYALQIGLTPKQSFTKYSRVDKDILAWIIAASKPDAFELYRWWFPFVGSVPYKGFFDQADAKDAAAALAQKGYETWMRGTEAFSTLGWFNDPVLSTTLKHDDLHVVNTVLHESTHTTLWLADHVDFNESLANFVGTQGAVDFYRAGTQRCLPVAPACEPAQKERFDRIYAQALLSHTREFALADIVEALYHDLDKLYASDISREAKLDQRRNIFAAHTSAFRQKYPAAEIFSAVNNAEIVQLKLYLTHLRDFDALYRKCRGDWREFFKAIRGLTAAVEHDRNNDPFALLKDLK
jgi:predicted aminopeptidase